MEYYQYLNFDPTNMLLTFYFLQCMKFKNCKSNFFSEILCVNKQNIVKKLM